LAGRAVPGGCPTYPACAHAAACPKPRRFCCFRYPSGRTGNRLVAGALQEAECRLHPITHRESAPTVPPALLRVGLNGAPDGRKRRIRPSLTAAHMTQMIMPQHANTIGESLGAPVVEGGDGSCPSVWRRRTATCVVALWGRASALSISFLTRSACGLSCNCRPAQPLQIPTLTSLPSPSHIRQASPLAAMSCGGWSSARS